jgi:hypothetical protein
MGSLRFEQVFAVVDVGTLSRLFEIVPCSLLPFGHGNDAICRSR